MATIAGTAVWSRSNDFAILEAIPVVDFAGAYASGELIGDEIEFAGAVPGAGSGRASGGSGIIQSVGIMDRAKQSVTLELALFTAEPTATTFTDQAAFDPADADLLNMIGVVPVADWHAFSDNSWGQALNLALPFIVAQGSNSLWGALICRGAPTYVAATDIKIRVGVLAG